MIVLRRMATISIDSRLPISRASFIYARGRVNGCQNRPHTKGLPFTLSTLTFGSMRGGVAGIDYSMMTGVISTTITSRRLSVSRSPPSSRWLGLPTPDFEPHLLGKNPVIDLRNFDQAIAAFDRVQTLQGAQIDRILQQQVVIRHHIGQQIHVEAGGHCAGRERSGGTDLSSVRRLHAREITGLPGNLHRHRL